MNRDIELDVLLRGRKFKRLVDDLYRDFRDRYGLKQAEVDVLVFLCEFPDRTPTEIAWELCMNKGHVSIATDGLCKKAYLLSERDAKDRRIVHFTVTEKGRTVNREILQVKDQVNEEFDAEGVGRGGGVGAPDPFGEHVPHVLGKRVKKAFQLIFPVPFLTRQKLGDAHALSLVRILFVFLDIVLGAANGRQSRGEGKKYGKEQERSFHVPSTKETA